MAIKGYLGQYELTLDDKGRVRIPSKFKAQMGEDTFVISCGNMACIKVYSAEKWDKLTEAVEQLSDFDEEAHEFLRTIYPNAQEANFDSVGRVLIPIDYREYAEFGKELVAVGLGDHFEIWDAENWAKGNYSSLEKRRTLQKEISQKLQGGKNGI